MTVKLFQFLYRETAGANVRIVAGSLISGVSRGMLLATFNAAALADTTGHRSLALLVAGFFGALVVYLAATYDSNSQAQRVIAGTTERLRLRFCAKLLLAQLRFLEIHGTAEIHTHLSGDLVRVSAAASAFLGIFQSMVLLVFGLVYLGWLSPWGLLVVSAAIPGGVIMYRIQDREARKNFMAMRVLQRNFYRRIHDLLRGFKELKLGSARQRDFLADLGDIAGQTRDLTVKTENLFLMRSLTSQTFSYAMIAAIVFVFPVIFPTSRATVFQFLATVLFLVGPFERLLGSFPAIARANISFESIQELSASLDEDVADRKGQDEAQALPFRTLTFKKTHFSFFGEGLGEAFDVGPIDLEIKWGEILFIVGGNGAGKTTFLKLLTGLYQPSAGAILVDGREIAPAERQSYREMFAAVFSDSYLFQRLYGLESPDPAVTDALLAELQIGHKTSMRDGAITNINLSTGQSKRLAYAVARLADRQIYVFDEFAADQDPLFRRHFYTELLPRLRDQGKTIIAVTHDDRWFSVADRVMKMDYGRIVEIAVKDRIVV